MKDIDKLLSATEVEIVRYIESGMTTKEIALKSKCSARTIEKHRSNIIKKLKLPKGSNLGLWVIKQRLRRK